MGKQSRRQRKSTQHFVQLLIWATLDGEKWAIVPPDKVPKWIWAEDVVCKLANGYGVRAPGEEMEFIATHVDELAMTPQEKKLVVAVSEVNGKYRKADGSS